MAPRALVIVAIAAIAGGIAWFELRGGHGETAPETAHEPPKQPGSAVTMGLAPTPPIAITQRTPDKPQLPDQPRPMLPDGGVPTLAQLYASEPRDLDWGPRTEKEIERRLAHLNGASLETTECHVSQCEITLSSTDEHGLQIAISGLEAQKGLAGLATTMMLTAPQKRADGSLLLRAFVSFER